MGDLNFLQHALPRLHSKCCTIGMHHTYNWKKLILLEVILTASFCRLHIPVLHMCKNGLPLQHTLTEEMSTQTCILWICAFLRCSSVCWKEACFQTSSMVCECGDYSVTQRRFKLPFPEKEEQVRRGRVFQVCWGSKKARRQSWAMQTPGRKPSPFEEGASCLHLSHLLFKTKVSNVLSAV